MIKEKYYLTVEYANYFIFKGSTSNQAYNYDYQRIMILYKNGKIKEVSEISDQPSLQSAAQAVVTYYSSYRTDIK